MAEALGKFRYEIEQMSCEEFDGWWLYFKWKSKESEKQLKKSAKNSGKGGKTITKL